MLLRISRAREDVPVTAELLPNDDLAARRWRSEFGIARPMEEE